MSCEVCGYCYHCDRGNDHGLWWYKRWFPNHAKILKEHYEIFPEHKKEDSDA